VIRSTVAALALLALFASPPARADDVTEARARFRKGAELYRAGKWRGAIAEFEAAYQLKPAGAIHYNIAQCREKLQEWPGALRSYHDYLRELPEAKDRAMVRASIVRIEGRLAAAGVQALLVYSDPPGATLTLDGRSRGTTPFQVVLPPGSYALALSLDGYETMKEDVVLSATASRVVDVVLRPAAPPAQAPSQAAPVPVLPPPDLRAQPPKGAAPSPLAARPPAARGEGRRVYTWVAAGAAVAAVAAGGYYGLAARRDADAVRSLSAPNGDEARRLTSSAQSNRRNANILYAAGGVAAAAGVTLFFVEKRF
jgi:tetratricopeptide (TPR) repeat protein